MEYASDAYKEAMQENVRGKSYVWASLDLVNQYAQDSAYISSNFSGSETNLYNDADPDAGATSTESDGSMTFTFGEYTTLLLGGVMFTLGNDPLPTSVTITNGTTSKTVTVSSEKVMLENDFSNCSYLKITPNSGNLNIKKIQFGFTIDFDHNLIMDTSRRNVVKHLNDELPMKEFSFTIHNYDRQWNKDNPFGYSRFLQEKQQIRYKYGREIGENDIYEINGGIVYLKEWTSDDYKATFSSVGLLDYLQGDYTKGRFYPDGITLYQLAEFVLQDAGIVKYELDAVLRTFTVTNPLPKDTHKACLQMIAHAGRCVLYEDRNGAVCLKSVDRPEILKTATLHDETSFSDGNDVITNTTVANYGSTEPNYTKADGLHYFYPETETHEEVDQSVNYMPFPYYSSSFSNLGFSYTVNSDHSITCNGTMEPGTQTTFFLIDKNNPITLSPGKYVLCCGTNINDSVGENSVRIILRRDRPNSNYLLIKSNETYQNRIFEIEEGDSIWSSLPVLTDATASNLTFYPHIYKFVEVYDEPTNTLPVGFVSEEFAKADGTFDSTPQIDINFASPCVLSEVVLNCAVAPKDLQIKTYLQGTQKSTQSITDNTEPQITQSINNIRCDKVTITFSKTTAYQRIHVNTVDLGAKIDYEITYHDMTATPVATTIEKISTMDFQLYAYSDPTDINASAGIGGVEVVYSALPSGGQAVDIQNSDTIAYIHVKPGLNDIELSGFSIAESAEYSDDIEGGTVTIIESGAYYAKVNASREGDIIIKGKEMVENIYSYPIAVNEIGNPIKVDNPLISTKEHADKLKDWFLEYYDDDIEYRLSYRGDPILDADDTVYLENQFVEDNLIRIQSEEISTSGGMNTSNQIIARRISYGAAKPDSLVAQDFTLNKSSISGLYVGDTDIITVLSWEPLTTRDRHVTFASEDTSVVTVSESGVVTAVGDGTTYITVTSDNGIVKRCAIEVLDEHALIDFVLNKSSLSLIVGETDTLSVVEWIPEDATTKTVTWSSSDTSIATVDQNGVVTAVNAGNVTISATSPNNIVKTCSAEVAYNPDIVRDFTLSPATSVLMVDGTVQLSVSDWVPSTALRKTVTYASSDTNIATVDANGLVTAVDYGNATITATCPDGISKTCSLTVAYELEGSNLIVPPYYSGSPVTIDGVEFTQNADGSITMVGTAEQSQYNYSTYTIRNYIYESLIPSPGRYIQGFSSDIKDSIGDNTYYGLIGCYDMLFNPIQRSYNSYADRIFEIPSGGNHKLSIQISVLKGTTVNTTFYPQIYKIKES